MTATATVIVTNHPGVFTHHNDNARTGQNLDETVPDACQTSTPLTFGKLRRTRLTGLRTASPLYVANVNIPGIGSERRYVATEHDSVYAFDADGLCALAALVSELHHSAAGITTVPTADIGECCDITRRLASPEHP